MGLTTDPREPCLQVIEPNGQQRCYLVLSETERAKGYVRPVRLSYVHRQCGSVTYMGQAIAETYARDPSFYGGTFCVHCGAHFDLTTPRNARRLEANAPGVYPFEWNFRWLDERGQTDGSYVGE
jgi:hypothetical protein